MSPRPESAHSRKNLCEYNDMVQRLRNTDGRNGRHGSMIQCECVEGRQGGFSCNSRLLTRH
jgi:hypothetical protein